jgi:hypothetical protein
MTFEVIDKICNEHKMTKIPLLNSIEIKGDKILLFKEKLDSELLKTYKYDKITSKKEPFTIEDIEGVLGELRNYFKERIIIFYKSSKKI